ncbi:hypothetical protein ACN38_g7442, partial [Penicillium nordicum]
RLSLQQTIMHACMGVQHLLSATLEDSFNDGLCSTKSKGPKKGNRGSRGGRTLDFDVISITL